MSSANGEQKVEAKPKVKVADFDLQAYADSYKGHAKVLRLLFVGELGDGLDKAFDIALSELQRAGDSKLAKQVGEKIGKPVDAKWIQDTEKEAAQTKERLDSDLNVAKTNLVKEDIRVAHNALGDFYYRRNDLNSALKCYVRTRDYCSSSQHILDMCMNVIRTSIELGNFSHVVNYVSKAEQTPDSNAATTAKLKVATGLSHLQTRKYKSAARCFLDACGELSNNQYNEVISSADLGIYAGICALAEFDRTELRRYVINNSRCKSCLDLTPEVQTLISAFYNCKYTDALQTLERLKPRLAIDLHMSEHVIALSRKIRSKAIVQFFYPYSSVDLKTMAAAFNTTVADLEQELKVLIIEDAIQARIDSFNQVLVAKKVDRRTQMFRKATDVGQEYQENMRDLLLRMDLAINDFQVKPPRREGGGGGGGGQGGKRDKKF